MREWAYMTVYEAEAFIIKHSSRALVTSVVSELLPLTGQNFVVSDHLVKTVPSDCLVAGLLTSACEILRMASNKTIRGKETFEINDEKVSIYMQCPHATISDIGSMMTCEILAAVEMIRAQQDGQLYKSLYRLVSSFNDIVVIDGGAMAKYETSGLSHLVAAATKALPPMTSYRTYSHVVDTRTPDMFTTMQLFIHRQGGPMPSNRDDMFQIGYDFSPNPKAIGIQIGAPYNAPEHAVLN